jgi:transcriptional regulator with XRE-family HTH domain
MEAYKPPKNLCPRTIFGLMVDKEAVAKNLGKNLKRLRDSKGLSMQDLATLAEIEKSQVLRIEKGKVDARISTLYILSAALKVDVSELFKPGE